jgi:hypothetical protein
MSILVDLIRSERDRHLFQAGYLIDILGGDGDSCRDAAEYLDLAAAWAAYLHEQRKRDTTPNAHVIEWATRRHHIAHTSLRFALRTAISQAEYLEIE